MGEIGGRLRGLCGNVVEWSALCVFVKFLPLPVNELRKKNVRFSLSQSLSLEISSQLLRLYSYRICFELLNGLAF